MPLPNPIFQGRSQAALPGGVAGSDKYPTLPPSAFSDMAAWFRFGIGITVTGAGVSQWDDASGNGRHLLQGTDANRPALQADGTILFNGTSHFLATTSFTGVANYSVYALLNPVSFTASDALFATSNGGSTGVYQNAPSPNIRTFSGSNGTNNGGQTIGAYSVVSLVVAGTSFSLQVNNNAPTVDTLTAVNMALLTLGSIPGGAAQWSNIQAKEFAAFSTAHDGTRRAQTIAWLNSL